jgi:hypothetical protein
MDNHFITLTLLFLSLSLSLSLSRSLSQYLMNQAYEEVYAMDNHFDNGSDGDDSDGGHDDEEFGELYPNSIPCTHLW